MGEAPGDDHGGLGGGFGGGAPNPPGGHRGRVAPAAGPQPTSGEGEASPPSFVGLPPAACVASMPVDRLAGRPTEHASLFFPACFPFEPREERVSVYCRRTATGLAHDLDIPAHVSMNRRACVRDVGVSHRLDRTELLFRWRPSLFPTAVVLF